MRLARRKRESVIEKDNAEKSQERCLLFFEKVKVENKKIKIEGTPAETRWV